MSSNQIAIGARFMRTDSLPYTENGAKGIHATTTLCEVTSTDRVGFRYSVVEVLAESGRPSFAGTPTGGSMAWFGFDAAIARGDVKMEA